MKDTKLEVPSIDPILAKEVAFVRNRWPWRYQGISFAKLKDFGWNRPALESCEIYARDFVAARGVDQGGLILAGTVGGGKTALMHATVRRILELAAEVHGECWGNDIWIVKWPRFVSTWENMKRCSDYQMLWKRVRIDEYTGRCRLETDGYDHLRDVVAWMRRQRLILIDDIGAQRRTDWDQETLLELLDLRSDEQMPTGMTCNFTPEEAVKRQLLDLRVMSRFVERATVVELKDHDLRLEEGDVLARNPNALEWHLRGDVNMPPAIY